MKFMFPTVYRVTQKDFCARPYTSMWAPVVARQISKRYSSSCHLFISHIEENDNYLDLVLFSDESTFQVCGKVNRHNCRIWDSENPHQVIEYERDTPKLNVWLGLHKHGVIGPFFFMESTVTGYSYLDMLGELCRPTDTSCFHIPAGRCPASLPHRCYHISG
jgi:hypothetical protein